ncbi:MAG: DUF2293 domain-containing protein [Opitutaceae bacterium]|jgi:hypothetical protein
MGGDQQRMRGSFQAGPAPESPRLREVAVFITRREGECAECGRAFRGGDLIRVEGQKTLCLDCADLGDLEYLPRGNTALTRRATKYSALRAVVLRWSSIRRRYERQGILVAPEAIVRAEGECAADAGVRERQRVRAAAVREADESAYVASVAATIRTLFPGCPEEEARRIAAWTCRKNSGRVGRSAAAKELDPRALRLAVVAHIRHEHTKYDTLLMESDDREASRQAVWPETLRVVSKWESPGS